MTFFSCLHVTFSPVMMTFLAFHTERFIYSPKIKILEMMIRSISNADYSYRYRLQPIVLIINPITRMAVISVQL